MLSSREPARSSGTVLLRELPPRVRQPLISAEAVRDANGAVGVHEFILQKASKQLSDGKASEPGLYWNSEQLLTLSDSQNLINRTKTFERTERTRQK